MIRALVVEDEYFVRKGLISTMPWAEFGVQVAGEASNGEHALEFMQEHPVDLLITDLAMPVMNGFELIRQARARFPHVRAVVLTCHEDFKYVQESLRMGALDYIVKTELENEQMRESLKRIVARFRESGEAKHPAPETAAVASWTEEEERRLASEIAGWRPLHWVVRDELFAELCGQLKSLNPPLARLQAAMRELLPEWSRTMGAELETEWLDKFGEVSAWSEWDELLARLRRRLQQRWNVISYPPDVVLRILDAAELLKTSAGLKVTQHELARRLNMSRSYFSKCFKALLGKTYYDYGKMWSIARAKLLLQRTAKPIADIAEECGFLDNRYFSRQFREETGMLPSEYRTRHQVDDSGGQV